MDVYPPYHDNIGFDPPPSNSQDTCLEPAKVSLGCEGGIK